MLTNDNLRAAYARYHEMVVTDINAGDVIDFLFAAKVLSAADSLSLSEISGRCERARRLMLILHLRSHKEAFIKLHDAIKKHESYIYLVEKIEDRVARIDKAARARKTAKTLKHVRPNFRTAKAVKVAELGNTANAGKIFDI